MTVDAVSSEKVRVLHLLGGKSLEGGTASVVRDLVVANSRSLPNWIWVHRDCVEVPELPLVRKGSAEIVSAGILGDLFGALRDLPALIRTIKRLKITVLHAHSRQGIFAGWWAHQLTGKPLIVHLHFLAQRAWLYRWLIKTARAVPIYNSRRTCEHYGGNPNVDYIIMPTISWPEDNLEESRTSRLVAASALVSNKNVDKIIDACGALQATRDAPNVVIYGLLPDETASSTQRAIVRKYRDFRYVTLVNWTRNWADLLRSADIFVHAGAIESFGLTILEAFARGVKVVVLRPSFLETFNSDAGRRGVYYSGASVEELARAVQRALADPIDTHSLRESRRAVSDQFSKENAGKKVNAIYQSLVPRRD